MQTVTSIRILESDTNRRGDLFGRLMADLFVALGYDPPRLNIHKSGRELDLSADHRLESRRAIGECKATGNPIGGSDLNKFVGALDAEHDDSKDISGYFVSLSGFTETAIEQELQRRRTRVITLDGQQVVNELIQGRILVPKERATEVAGQLRADTDHLVLDINTELLAHQRGWIWAVYYTQGKARTHFALIHSDGTPLARVIAEEVITADRDCKGELCNLSCLNPPPIAGTDTDPNVSEALAAYRQYLVNECGFIQLDGLPADTDVGSRRLRLENLFVPLHLDVTAPVGREPRKVERQQVGSVLAEHRRLALLAAPGGGKSTLIKRLAVAYTDAPRRSEVSDELPKHDWLPLFFRCRELRELARGSFAELLESLSQRELVRNYATVFRGYIDRALLTGRILLLVDGLDEISDPGDRAAFVCTLRSAMQAYPQIAVVITSREAGFRHVAAHLAPICTHVTLSPFDASDIRRLSVAWHREVVGDTEKVRADAEQLADTIVRSDRIRRLAVNPLLLTTLLLVKRWVGSLPTRRAVLYGKAVEVLLMTWNTEGHDPIPEEEALPQLCYVASAMMLEGVQKISRPHLATLLQRAREALPTELGYVQGTVDQFIHRVEDRSSLLMMTGHDVEDGQLVEFFEFRHLTFQEFLTARAMVEGWHPGRQENDTLVSVLEPHFEKEEWREVIPLGAVLGGKATEALIKTLTESLEESETSKEKINAFGALVNCLADEAAARPETIRAAIRQLVRRGTELHHIPSTPMLVRGKYGRDLQEESERAFLSGSDVGNSGDALLMTVWWRTVESENSAGYQHAAKQFLEMLDSSVQLTRCKGATGLGRLCGELLSMNQELGFYTEVLRRAGPKLVAMVYDDVTPECASGCFALEKVGAWRIWTPDKEVDLISRFFSLWQHHADPTVRNLGARAAAGQPLLSRADGRIGSSIARDEAMSLLGAYDDLDLPVEKAAALIVAFYLELVPDSDLMERARNLMDKHFVSERTAGRTLKELLEQLDKGQN